MRSKGYTLPEQTNKTYKLAQMDNFKKTQYVGHFESKCQYQHQPNEQGLITISTINLRL